MVKDLRHAVRRLLHDKAWTSIVVLSLGLGIGANTAIFSAVNGLLLTKIPVQDPDTLVRLRSAGRNDMVTSSSDYGFAAAAGGRTSGPRSLIRCFSSSSRQPHAGGPVRVRPFGRVNVAVNGQAESRPRSSRSGNYSGPRSEMRSRPDVIGPRMTRPTAPPVAVISVAYWHSRFGTDRGPRKTVSVNNVQVTIVGVLHRAFTGIQQPLADRQTCAPARPRPAADILITVPRSRLARRPTGGCR